MVHDAFKKVRVNTVVSCNDHCYSQSSSVNMLLFLYIRGRIYTGLDKDYYNSVNLIFVCQTCDATMGCTIPKDPVIASGLHLHILLSRLLDSLVVECWLRVREVPGSIPSQGPCHIKDVIKMVPVVALFSIQH